MTPEDHLLNYARTSDEQAFTKVVDAFASLVYGTALRRTRNASLSEEITQNVFVILARKAERLGKVASLGGWLHRTTLLESNNALRSEGARKRRLEAMKNEEAPPTGPQSEILPDVIDEALNRLSAPDRQVVLLRFFEGREFEEIGSRLGKSAAAVQKQIRRALAKLHQSLTSRGATLSLSGLGLALSTELTRSAPLVSTTTISTNVLTAAATAEASSPIMATMLSVKPTTATLALIALCAIPLVTQQVAISKAEHELDTLTAAPGSRSHGVSSNHRPRTSSPTHPAREFLAAVGSPLDGATLFHELQNAHASDDMAAAVRLCLPLTAMSEEELQSLLNELETTPGPEGYRNIFFRTLAQYSEEYEKNPGPLLTRQLANGMIPLNLMRDLTEWAARDPKAALAWFQTTRKDGTLLGTGVHTSPELHLGKALAEELAKTDPTAAFALADEIEPEFRNDILASVVRSLLSSPEGETDPRELLGRLEDPHPKVIQAAAEALAESGRRDQIRELLETVTLDPNSEATALALAAAKNRHQEDVPDRMDWLLQTASEEARDKSVSRAVSRLYRQEPAATTSWIDTLPEGGVRDSALAAEAVAMMQDAKFARAYERAGLIKSLQERWMTRQAIKENWKGQDPEGARKAKEDPKP